MYRAFQRDSAFSTLSKWNLFQTYTPRFLISTGYKYLNLIFLDTFSDLLPILSSSKKFESVFHDIMHGSVTINIDTSEIPIVREFLYSIIFLLLAVGYLDRTHLLFVSWASSELQTEFEKVKFFMIPSSMIELKKFLDRYPTSEQNSFWLKNLFLVTLELLGDSLEEIRDSASGGNMLGPAYGKRKNVNGGWIDDKIESSLANSDSIVDEERELLVQFSTLMTEGD
ncbi:hypothetical protein M9H77_26331 [Catharanthus roseus]|uniref:Uncharacterized protein n=1 Tax=Catharanthus roseus TaxID=4058 RepID=A0ACC0A9E3_CATRO|nr:hypothetical protein M9H77_26331 [Catharanthus roseus]